MQRQRLGMDANLFFRHCADAEPPTAALYGREDGHSAQFEGEIFFGSAERNEARATVTGDFAVRAGRSSVEPAGASDRTLMYSIVRGSGRPERRSRAKRSAAFRTVMTHSELPVLNQAIQWEMFKEILAGDFPGVALAADAPAGIVDGNPAGVSRDRFAGGARFLSSVHGGRTFAANDRSILQELAIRRMSGAFRFSPL